MLSRMVSAKYFSLSDVAVIPEWTPFHKTVSFTLNFPTIIGNCRSYPSPLTSMTYVDTVLLSIEKMLNKVGMSSHIVSYNEPFINYLKKFSGRQKSNLTTCLRESPHCKNLLGVIGKRMYGSGFSEILEDTSSYGPTKVKGNM